MMTTTTSKSQEQVVQQQQQQQLKKIKKERGRLGYCCNIYRLFLLLNIISFLQYYYYRNIYNNDSTITVETTTTMTTVATTVAIKSKDKNDSKNKKKQRRSPLKITRFIGFDGNNSTNNNSNNNRSNNRNKHKDSNQTTKILLTTDFSDLIDVTILGFPKCGTTSLSSWFQNHPEIYSMSGEPTFMTDSNMSDIHTVQALYNFFYHNPKEQKVYRKQEQARNNENIGTSPTTITTDDIRIRAYKNPGDIYKKLAIQNIQNHFPSMKLIIGIRHPVLWFESFYNYWNTIADNGRRQPLPIDPIELIGPCNQQVGIANVCTDHAAFHYYLKRIIGDTSTGSSTPTNTSNSSNSSNSGDSGGNFVLPNNNPIFIYEITQLTDTNKTRMKQFTTDIKNYLGIEKDFKTDAPPKYNTLKKITKTRHRRSRSKHSTSTSTNTNTPEPPLPPPPLPPPRIINICDYPKVHEVLMKHSIDTANYIKGLLLSNENDNENHSSSSNNNIITFSSKEYLLSILETKYRQDPCDSRKEEKKKNKRKEKSSNNNNNNNNITKLKINWKN